MGHFVMVSLWYASLSTNTRFHFPNDSGRPLSYNNFADKKKNKMAATKKQCSFAFSVLN